jgi:hypothetical protein
MFIERGAKPWSADQLLPFQKKILKEAEEMDHFMQQIMLVLTKKL